jgi:HTH-type transcriptional regulator, competence development regulator
MMVKGCVIMNFGEYIKNLRNENNLSQRDLSLKSGVSNAEISRIETGERQKPSPMALKAFAPHLGKPYEELMQKAGYIEEVVDHEGYLENIYRDEKGHLVDIVRRAKDMYEKDSNWANLAYRVTAANLSDSERDIIKVQTEVLLEQFLKNKKK